MSPLFKLVGSKYYLSSWITQFFPPHDLYVEPFLGAGAVFLNKAKAPHSILNDINPAFYAAWEYIMLLDDKKIKRLRNTKFCLETFQKATQRLEKGPDGYSALVVQRMSRGGLGKTFSKSDRLRGGKIEGQNAWDNWVNSLSDLDFINVQILNEDFSQIFDEYGLCGSAAKNSLIFMDPPYLTETRRPNLYTYEMDRRDHIIMAAYCLNTPANVVICGYDNELYRQIFKDWNRAEKDVANHSGQNKKKERRKEVLWMNF